jgi:UDP-glucose 4-epimerase
VGAGSQQPPPDIEHEATLRDKESVLSAGPTAIETPLSLTGRNILVTGGAGFIGSHLVERIAAERPTRLVVVDNLFLGKESNLAGARALFPGLKIYRQDASDFDAMAAIVASEGIDVLFNLAIVPLPASLVNPRWTVNVNTALATVPCELLRLGYYKTLIHFSSSEAYGSAGYVPMDEGHPCVPSTPYAASKLAGDYVVLSYRETYGIDASILRPFNNYGPRQNAGAYAGILPIVIGNALRGEPVHIFGDGEQTRDFVYVRDTADAAVRVFANPVTRGLILNIASGRETSINVLVHELFTALGVDVPVIHEAPRPGDVRRHCGSIELARELIAYESKTSLLDGLQETVDWYRSSFANGEPS